MPAVIDIAGGENLEADANPELFGGWPMILSGLKTLLETREQLDTHARCATAGAAGK